MTLLGTALRPAATRVMLLEGQEEVEEVAIECLTHGDRGYRRPKSLSDASRQPHVWLTVHTSLICWTAKRYVVMIAEGNRIISCRK